MEDKNKPTKATEIPAHLILREVLRHYTEFKAYVTSHMDDHIIEHSYYVDEEDGTKRKVTVSISFWDLQGALAELAPRKREAVFWNVIMDYKQKDAARIMGITTVSIGQYTSASMEQIAAKLFSSEHLTEETL
jgi:DNA-directed RNA polymerase specialized sigma24 family protein